jgi:hypothetical protein
MRIGSDQLLRLRAIALALRGHMPFLTGQFSYVIFGTRISALLLCGRAFLLGCRRNDLHIVKGPEVAIVDFS